jgi:hypothetical protein
MEHLKKHVEGRNHIRDFILIEVRLEPCEGGGDVDEGGMVKELDIGNDFFSHQIKQDLLHFRKLTTGSTKECEAVVMRFAEQVRGNDGGCLDPLLDVANLQRVPVDDVRNHTGHERHQKIGMPLFN